MGYPPLEELLPKTDYSIYKLVRMASNRAIELADGKPRLIETPSLMKTTTIALEEIQNAKVVLKEVADRFLPDDTVGKKTGELPAEA
jgi:DNA-directed RNA polymerase omega subunit